MPVDPELLEIIVCPETRQPVKPADASLLARLNADIDTGSLRNRSGAPVTQHLTEALVREDGRLLYPVDDRIPVMLIEESIEIGE